jgi:hypothetical protein
VVVPGCRKVAGDFSFAKLSSCRYNYGMAIQRDELVTTQEAAEIIGVQPATVRKYRKRVRLTTGKVIGNTLFFSREEVEAFKQRPAGRPKTK